MFSRYHIETSVVAWNNRWFFERAFLARLEMSFLMMLQAVHRFTLPMAHRKGRDTVI